MSERLTDHILKTRCPAPATGNKVYYDSEVRGLGLRVTAAGAKAFIYNYRFNRRERRYTIGPYGRDQWTLAAARKRAGELRKMLERGEDPLAKRIEGRNAPTIGDLCDRFEEEHLPKLRASTQREYKALAATYIKPALKHRQVATIEFDDVDGLHRKISKTAPYRANRVVALLSKMFSLAGKWKWRSAAAGNPAKGIERNQEQKRERHLSSAELGRLSKALDEYEDQQAANIIRLLLLTGARRGEVQAMKRADLDLDQALWTKPGATTKQKTIHRVPLSEPACQLLKSLEEEAEKDAVYVFPGRYDGHRVEIKDEWAAICKAAKIKGARMHDLRHTYASILASSGLSLPIIGALLGHTQAQTTKRYAHLFDDPLRKATEQVGAVVTGKPSAEVVRIKDRA
jgi:integrase